jgi:phosphopantothenoylcysteine decarboxylase/phosphopantothenate--cysteine ligase
MMKKDGPMSLELEPTEDILAWMGRVKQPGQFLVGFALETNDERQHAEEKLVRKHLDLIVLNSLNDPGAGFGHDTNKVTLIDARKNAVELPLMSKQATARAILDHLEKMISHAR